MLVQLSFLSSSPTKQTTKSRLICPKLTGVEEQRMKEDLRNTNGYKIKLSLASLVQPIVQKNYVSCPHHAFRFPCLTSKFSCPCRFTVGGSRSHSSFIFFHENHENGLLACTLACSSEESS